MNRFHTIDLQAKTRLTTVVPISHMAPRNKFCFPPSNSVLPHFFLVQSVNSFHRYMAFTAHARPLGGCFRNGAVVSHLSGKAEFEKLHRLHLCHLKASMKLTARTWDIFKRELAPNVQQEVRTRCVPCHQHADGYLFSGTFLSLLLVFCPLA